MQPARQQQMAGLAAEEGHRVGCALTAAPITAPVVPLMPLGRSTATTGTPDRIDRLDHRPRRARRPARSSPAPNSASTMMSQSFELSGSAGVDRPAPARAAAAASPLSAGAVADKLTPHREAALGQMPAATKPSPPLLPGPAPPRPRACPADRARPHRRPRCRPLPSGRCPACRRRSSAGRPRAISAVVSSSMRCLSWPRHYRPRSCATIRSNSLRRNNIIGHV